MRRSSSVWRFLVLAGLLSTNLGTAAAQSDVAQWIWYSDATSSVNVPAGKCYFRRQLTIPADRTIQSAVCSITVDNAFVLFINGKRVGSGDD
ncbi:MAG: hypothetical protein NTY19_19215 [Planctomycetota bacterium]|nr:hypothetical protein [Planctomycetota bacterium]